MKYIIALGTAVTVVAIASYMVLSLNMRMIADDYCMTANIQNYGAIGTLERYYSGWSGQFSYPFVKAAVFYTLGLDAHTIMPIAIYSLWWLGNLCLLWIIFRRWAWQGSFWISLILSAFHLFNLLSTMASRQTMYWLDALLFHVFPLAILVWIVVAWWMAIQSPKWKKLKMLFFFIVLFVYGGVHILPTLFGLSFWVLAIGIIWRYTPDSDKQTYLPITLAAFAGLALAFIIVVIAPGNTNRMGSYENIGVLDAIVVSLQDSVRHWFSPLSLIHFFSIVTSVMAVCGLWTSQGYIPENNHLIETLRRHSWLLLGIALLAGILYTAGSLFLPAISTGQTSTRVYVTAGLTKTWVSLWIGFILGLRYVQTRYFPSTKLIFSILATSVLVLAGAYRIVGNIELWPVYEKWSQEWDERHNALLGASENGAVAVEIVPFTIGLPKFLGPDTDGTATNFTRNCMERYYGISQIEVTSSLESGATIRIVEPE